MSDEILITDVRNIGYSFKSRDWSFSVGQRIESIGVEIDRIYLDQPYLDRTGIERFIIEIMSLKFNNPTVWRVIEKHKDGTVFVLELKI